MTSSKISRKEQIIYGVSVLHSIVEMSVSNTEDSGVSANKQFTVIGAFNANDVTQKICYSARPLGSVISPEKTSLQINVGELSLVSSFELAIHDSVEEDIKAIAWCVPFKEGFRLCIELHSGNFFKSIQSGLSLSNYGVAMKVSFTLSDCWEDESEKAILFAEEKYSASNFELSFAANNDEFKGEITKILSELQILRYIGQHELPGSVSKQYSDGDSSADTALEIKELVDDVKTELSLIQSSVSSIDSNSGDTANLQDEVIRLGNVLSGIRVLLFLIFIALLVIIFR